MKKTLITLCLFSVSALCFADDYRMEQDWIKTIEANSEADFAAGRKLLSELVSRGGERESILERPHIIVRSQTKYSGRLYSDFYNWHLRPLFASRLLWEPEGSDHKFSSFRKSYELMRMYGLDGIATFVWSGPTDRVISVLYDTAARMYEPGEFSVMLEVSPNKEYLEMADDKLDYIITNPYAFRINGKSVISSYNMDNVSAERVSEFVKVFRERSGDRILFLPQMNFMSFRDETGKLMRLRAVRKVYSDRGSVPATLLLRMMEYLREYARASDGLYIGSPMSAEDSTLDDRFSDEVLFPLYKAVLNEREFGGEKILAMAATVGYTSYHGSQSRSRDGTKTLRKCMELIDRHRPDLVICPEWDELNEDTGFQPQVSCPMSTQRIMKHYTDGFRGKTPGPNPGDDLAIPNLIVSQRRQLTPGWTHDIELLNVPDTPESEEYAVRLEVLNETGEVLYSAPAERFDRSILKDRTYKLPSEDFARSRALCTRLTVDYAGETRVYEEGLPFTVLRGTTCWDQTYANTPLRNLLLPSSARIEFSDPERDLEPGIGRVRLDADIEAGEKLATVEVVQDSLEIFAWDPQNEFLQNSPERRLYNLRFQNVSNPIRGQFQFRVNLEGAPSALTYRSYSPVQKAEAGSAFTQNYRAGLGRWDGRVFKGAIDHWPKSRTFSLEKGDVGSAVFSVEAFEVSSPENKYNWTLPLSELGEYGIKSTVFTNGLMFALETYHRPLVNPLPLDSNRASFSRALLVDNPAAVLAVRAVSEEGKVYWSRPYAFNSEPSTEKRKVPSYANSSAGFADLLLDAFRVPVIEYEFSPRYGNILHTGAGREFYGHVGSYMSVAIGFVGEEHAGHAIPFSLYSKSIFKEANRPAPLWSKDENGDAVLEFDGENGNFIGLPATFMPQRAGFTLSFEIKPADDKREYVLFHHGAVVNYGGLTVGVKNGRYDLAYVRRTPDNPELPNWSRLYFPTEIPVRPGEWQKVTITRDSSDLSIDVDGVRASFPCHGVGLFMQPSVFGGWGGRLKDGSAPFFKGRLRSLSIKHCVD